MKSLCGILITDDEDIFLAHTEDLCRTCEKKYSPVFTAFLDERRQMLAETLLRSMGVPFFRFYGGYDNAVRKVLCIYPEYSVPENEDFPISAVKFSFRKSDSVTHSRLLGTVMSLGIKRELTGDMICGCGFAYALLSPAAALPAAGITKIGGVGVKAEHTDTAGIVREECFDEMRLSVSSLRLDCIFSAAARLSRSKSADIIRSEGAEVNYVKVFSPDRLLSEGDVFSVRGKGKFLLVGTDGQTRSGRVFVNLKKYR